MFLIKSHVQTIREILRADYIAISEQAFLTDSQSRDLFNKLEKKINHTSWS